MPNNLLENSTYLANDLVPLILSALGMYNCKSLSENHRNRSLLEIGVADPDGEIALSMTEKYLGYAEMGNFQSMIPGLTDVSRFFYVVYNTFG